MVTGIMGGVDWQDALYFYVHEGKYHFGLKYFDGLYKGNKSKTSTSFLTQ